MLAQDRLDLRGHLPPPQALELEALRDPLLLPARGHPPERVRSVELIRAGREDQEQPPAARARREQSQEVERRPIRPLEVLEYEHQRGVLRQPRDHPDHQLEQAGGVALLHCRSGQSVAKLRHEPPDLGPGRAEHVVESVGGQLTCQGAHHVDQRRERDPSPAELHAAADEHARAGAAGAPDQLVDEPRLSHPGLAADQHGDLLAGEHSLQRTCQDLQLRLASHQDGADETRRHAGIMSEANHSHF